MTDPELYKELGALGAEVKALNRTLAGQVTRSEAGRARLYDQTEKIATTLSAIDRRLEDTERKLQRIEPLAMSYGDVRGRWKTIAAFLVVVWIVLGGLFSEGIRWLVARFSALLFGP